MFSILPHFLAISFETFAKHGNLTNAVSCEFRCCDAGSDAAALTRHGAQARLLPIQLAAIFPTTVQADPVAASTPPELEVV